MRVLLQVAGAREALLVKMDEFGELRLPGGLRGEVFADGSTRTLRIRDEHQAPSGTSGPVSGGVSSGTSGPVSGGMSGGSAPTGDEVARYTLQVKLAGLGVSVIDAKLDEVMYAGVLDIDLAYSMTSCNFETELKIGNLQVDNQTDNGPEIALRCLRCRV